MYLDSNTSYKVIMEIKMTEKLIADALKKSEVFGTLSPEEMLWVIIKDMEANGTILKRNHEIWDSLSESRKAAIDQETRFDMLLYIMNTETPAETFTCAANTGIFEFCLPKCFPLKRSLNKRDMVCILNNFNECKGDVADNIALMMFPFERNSARATLTEAGIHDEMIEWIMDALGDIDNFTLIKDKRYLKRFIYEKGWDYYGFMDRLAENLSNTLDFPDYKRLSKKYLLEEIKSLKEPIFPSEMDIDKEDLKELGIAEEQIEEIMRLLIEYCHSNPLNNKNSILIKRAGQYSKSKLLRPFRKVHWIR